MAMALGRALDCLGCLGGGHGSSRSYRYSYYAPNPIGNSTYRYDFGRVRGRKGRGRSLSLQTVELKVRMCCEGCERVVKHALHKLRGVDSVEVNLPLEKVTVTGYVDRNKVLKEVRRSGKRRNFGPNPTSPVLYNDNQLLPRRGGLPRELQLLAPWVQRRQAREPSGEPSGRGPRQQHVQRRRCECVLHHVMLRTCCKGMVRT
ncbi:hypothetical protein HPP92_022267 [Vanilla planifolia]|uniref:HMA domain-containing protein n=1 Tax=Vanilla planifolia TaxID=51239 RepID=A0A835PR66_VANPL|nr:hypothetical protein HPP92_022267 [Vanilla planifolia]